MGSPDFRSPSSYLGTPGHARGQHQRTVDDSRSGDQADASGKALRDGRKRRAEAAAEERECSVPTHCGACLLGRSGGDDAFDDGGRCQRDCCDENDHGPAEYEGGRSQRIGGRDPITEITRYLSVHRSSEENVLRTLSAFDGVNFAKRSTAPTLFSVWLMDPTCPPSTVYAAFNHHAAASKRMVVYPYNGHEGGGHLQRIRQAEWLNMVLADASVGDRSF